MAISAKDVMELRKQTDCGMMECKKALTQPTAILRKPSRSCASRAWPPPTKRPAASPPEGMVYAVAYPNCAVVVEVNAETDFVAKNDKFVEFTKELAQVIADQNPADVEALMGCKMGEGTVDDAPQGSDPRHQGKHQGPPFRPL